MTYRISATVILANLLCAACGDPDPVCPYEFFEGSVTFPSGTTHQACSPSGPEGIAVVFSLITPCSVANAVGTSSGGEWSVASGWEAADPLRRGDWFARLGPTKISVSYAPTAAPPSTCVPGDPLSCDLNAYGCDFELTDAANAFGDVVEGHLIAPCEMRVAGDYINPWRPTLTSMRFRARLNRQATSDAGVGCALP